MAMTLEFGRSEQDRPAYIGVANTFIAPFTFLAPVIGGLLADQRGYQVTFLVSALAGLVTLAFLFFTVKDPPKRADVEFIPMERDLIGE
jgi:MFS family permease